jgi:DNA (cytosine-5)-methyltransferase 1
VREALKATGKPYIIENVIGAPLHCPILLCGTMFDLTTADKDGKPLFLRRHRLFESNVWLTEPIACRCVDFKARGMLVAGVYGGGSTGRNRISRIGYTPAVEQRRRLIDAPWMTLAELSQSIPPAYTEWIGRQVLAAMEMAA